MKRISRKEQIDNILAAMFSCGMAYMKDKLDEDPKELRKKMLNKILYLIRSKKK